MATTREEFVLTLTDDEIVAVAVADRTFYPGDLPTVDVDSEASLVQASLRGRRSLIARGWIGEDGKLAADVAPARSAAGAPRFANVFIGDEELNRVDWSLATSIYPSASGWVIEAVSGTGLHRLAVATDDECLDSVKALVAGAFTTSQSQPAPAGAWLIVSVLQEGRSRLLAVRPGAVRLASIEEGRLSTWTTASADDLPTWIDATMASLKATMLKGVSAI